MVAKYSPAQLIWTALPADLIAAVVLRINDRQCRSIRGHQMKLFRVGIAAFACLLLLSACKQEGETPDEEAEEETPPVPVETSVPVRGDIFATYTCTAPIEAFAEADVIAKVDGEVRELHVEEGDMVSKNQILATLDGDRLRL